MGCASSGSLHCEDGEGSLLAFWVDPADGGLMMQRSSQASSSTSGPPSRLEGRLLHWQLGPRPCDGFLADGRGRVGALTAADFRKLAALARRTGLSAERQPFAAPLQAAGLEPKDQLLFEPGSSLWREGGYRHCCRSGTVVEFLSCTTDDGRCQVRFPKPAGEHGVLLQDLRFHCHRGSKRAVAIDAQQTVSWLVDVNGKRIDFPSRDWPAAIGDFRSAIARRLGSEHPAAGGACSLLAADGIECEDMAALYRALGRGDVVARINAQAVHLLENPVPPQVVKMSGEAVGYALEPGAYRIGDLRLALARPLGHTPLAVPGLHLVDMHARQWDDDDLIADTAHRGPLTVVLNAEAIADLESPPKLAVAVAQLAAEDMNFGIFYHGVFDDRKGQVKLQYNYVRRELCDGQLLPERYDYHIYSLEEKRFVEHGRVGPE